MKPNNEPAMKPNPNEQYNNKMTGIAMTPTQRQHTKKPWHNSNSTSSIIFKDTVRIVDCDTISNATHIVHCVNSHEQLIEALKGLLDNLCNDNIEEFEIKAREVLEIAQKEG